MYIYFFLKFKSKELFYFQTKSGIQDSSARLHMIENYLKTGTIPVGCSRTEKFSLRKLSPKFRIYRRLSFNFDTFKMIIFS